MGEGGLRKPVNMSTLDAELHGARTLSITASLSATSDRINEMPRGETLTTRTRISTRRQAGGRQRRLCRLPRLPLQTLRAPHPPILQICNLYVDFALT